MNLMACPSAPTITASTITASAAPATSSSSLHHADGENDGESLCKLHKRRQPAGDERGPVARGHQVQHEKASF